MISNGITNKRALGAAYLLKLLLLFLFLAVLILTFYSPFYTDELFYFFSLSRIQHDGGNLLLSWFPQCATSYEVTAPLTWLPISLVRQAIFNLLTHPQQIRALGMAVALINIIIAARILSVAHPKVNKLNAILLMGAAFSVGAIPYLMVLKRPEQTIVFCIFSISLLTLYALNTKSRYASTSKILSSLLSLFLVTVLLSSHSKGLLLLPYCLTCIVLLTSGIRRVIITGLFFFISLESYLYYENRLQCPDQPLLNQFFLTWGLTPSLLLSDPLTFMRTGLSNLSNSFHYYEGILLRSQFQLEWLPPINNNLINVLTKICIVLASSLTCLIAYNIFIGIRGYTKISSIDKTSLLSVALLLSLLGLSFFQSNKFFYETGLFYPLCILLLMLTSVGRTYNSKPLRIFWVYLVCVGLLSSLWNIYQHFHWKPGWKDSNHSLPHQPTSVSFLGYKNWMVDISYLAESCKLGNNQDMRHLVVDDATLFYFRETYQPFNELYTIGAATPWGKDIEDPLDFLQKKQSNGVIVRCKSIPASLLPYIHERNGLCCIKSDSIGVQIDK